MSSGDSGVAAIAMAAMAALLATVTVGVVSVGVVLAARSQAVSGADAAALAAAVATYPADGTQLESMERVIDTRLNEDRNSLLRILDLADTPFARSIGYLGCAYLVLGGALAWALFKTWQVALNVFRECGLAALAIRASNGAAAP